MSTPKGVLNDDPRDEQIAQAYRDAVRADATPAGPPIALDDAIRAAARRAAHAGPETLESATRRSDFIATGGFLWRWRAPLGAAATLALAIGIAIKIYDTGEADIAVEKSRTSRNAAPAQMADTGIESRTLSATDQARNRDQQPGVGAPTELQDVGRSKEDAPRLAVQSAPTPSDTLRSEPTAPTAERPTFREGVVASADAERQRLAPGAPALKWPQEDGRALNRAEERQQLATPSAIAESTRADLAAPPTMAPAPAPSAALAQAGARPATEGLATRQRSIDDRLAPSAQPAGPSVGSQHQRPERRAVMEDRMAAGGTVNALIVQLAARPVDAWFEEIRALKRAGRIADANTLLAEFKKRFPNTVLPDDLR